jgi:diketogulonate reductase-like aldo/keto reductase
MVLQNKFDLYHPGRQLDPRGNDDVQALCNSHNIKLIGYSPLSAFPFVLTPLQDPIVQAIAEKRQVPPAEVATTV